MASARDKLAHLTPPRRTASTPLSARDLYSTLSQNEPGDVVVPVPQKARLCVDSPLCNGLIAFVIVGNTVVIGLECQSIRDPQNQDTYSTLEAVFCTIYVVEIILRCSQHGLTDFFCARDAAERGWNFFDFSTTLVGAVGLCMSELLDIHINASVLRLLRILRILRVFRILKFMKDIEYTLVSAMTSMVRIMFLVLMIDFIGAVVITHLLHDTSDEVIHEMFGELSSSMYTLFIVMVDGMGALHLTDEALAPGGMVIITEKVTEVHPHMSLFWIAFVFVGTISLMALVPAIFVELNLRDAEAARKRQEKEEWEHRVEAQRAALEVVFQAADKDHSNAISRQEMDDFLQSEDVLKQVGLDQDEEDEDGLSQGKLDVRQLRMEFSMVYDAIEAEGRHELSCSEFIEAFRQMRAKPMDQVVLTMQQEIFKLRTLMMSENQKLKEEIRRGIEGSDKQGKTSPVTVGRAPRLSTAGRTSIRA